jgi:hypothetical protein
MIYVSVPRIWELEEGAGMPARGRLLFRKRVHIIRLNFDPAFLSPSETG